MGKTNENQLDLKELVKEIAEQKILLPDFQRDFRWKKEEEQKKLVASVLARMPIGSILMLRSDPEEYGAKTIGHIRNERQIIQAGNQEERQVKFLLDGQQRVTVLTNVFSNIIFSTCEKRISELYPALKRRFFLRIPRWTDLKSLYEEDPEEAEEKDLFGVYHFRFRYADFNKDPEFLSGDIEPFIECKNFKAEVKEAFHPFKKISVDLDTFCLSQQDGYYIPLYLLADTSKIGKLRRGNIIESISDHIKQELENAYTSLDTEYEKEKFICKTLQPEENEIEDVGEFLTNAKQIWQEDMKEYLDVCLRELKLNQIIMNAEQRSRAIDIYENMNRGGVSLNTFDLMMARVATVTQDSFATLIKDQMEEVRQYPQDVIPDKIQNIFQKKKEYNATRETRCYDYGKKEFRQTYIDIFLDVLSIYCHNPNLLPDEFKLDHIKKDKILNLDPKKIRDSYSVVCKAIDRALFFFQVRCGIRFLNELNYSLMLVIVAVIFTRDDYFKDKQVHDILDAWYWASVFAGEFDKDQNQKALSHLKNMTATLKQGENKKSSTGWIRGIGNDIFKIENFSGKELLLMDKAADDRLPKKILQKFVCQYWLSETYSDMFEHKKIISVFCEEADELEAHHIIPLGSVTEIGQSSKELRKDKKHICNSPLNFVYITQKANKDISTKSLEDYAKKITAEARTSLHIKYNVDKMESSVEKIHEELEERFEALKGSVGNKLNTLLP